jgi:hypothetical protein
VALVTVLLVLTVLLGLGLAALGLTLTHKDISRTELNSLRAFYAAEAGIQVALAQLSVNPEWPGYDPARGVGSLPGIAAEIEGAQIKEVIPTPLGEVLQIEARGESGGLTRQVAALVQKPAWAYGLVLSQAADASIGGNSYLRGTFIFAGNVTIGSSVEVGDPQAKDGWIIAGGNVVNRGRIYGGVRARGTVDNTQGIIVGVVQQGVEVYVPSVRAPDLEQYRLLADQVLSGNVTWRGSDLQSFIDSGKQVLYVDGNLVLDEQGSRDIIYSGRAVLVASGNIEVRADVKRAPGTEGRSALALIAGGNIALGNQEVEALLWAGGSLQTHGSRPIRGAAVAGTLDVSGQFNLTYDPTLVGLFLGSDSPLAGDAGFRMVRWWAKGS